MLLGDVLVATAVVAAKTADCVNENVASISFKMYKIREVFKTGLIRTVLKLR